MPPKDTNRGRSRSTRPGGVGKSKAKARAKASAEPAEESTESSSSPEGPSSGAETTAPPAKRAGPPPPRRVNNPPMRGSLWTTAADASKLHSCWCQLLMPVTQEPHLRLQRLQRNYLPWTMQCRPLVWHLCYQRRQPPSQAPGRHCPVWHHLAQRCHQGLPLPRQLRRYRLPERQFLAWLQRLRQWLLAGRSRSTSGPSEHLSFQFRRSRYQVHKQAPARIEQCTGKRVCASHWSCQLFFVPVYNHVDRASPCGLSGKPFDPVSQVDCHWEK